MVIHYNFLIPLTFKRLQGCMSLYRWSMTRHVTGQIEMTLLHASNPAKSTTGALGLKMSMHGA